jgi:hypothetical protein
MYGRGFGFRGSSPEWPYVGMGRGGLPRCGAYLSGYGPIASGSPYRSYNKVDELESLKSYAENLKRELERINNRIAELENK